jgi:hypothetical protein
MCSLVPSFESAIVPVDLLPGGPLGRLGKNGGNRGGGGFFGMGKANIAAVDKNAKDKVRADGTFGSRCEAGGASPSSLLPLLHLSCRA